MNDIVLNEFGFDSPDVRIAPHGSGLINHTWTVEQGGEKFILQKVNDLVFKKPQDIAHNIEMASDYLAQHHPGYFFVPLLKTKKGKNLVYVPADGYYRVFPFVKNSHSIDVVKTPAQAKEAAMQFGRFTKLLSGIDVEQLKITLPHFHDLTLRYRQYREAVETGNPARIAQCREAIEKLDSYAYIAGEYESIKQNPEFRQRVTHHDTKISNVLFDDADQGICVIDLDTVMPGFFISDVGDMMRTYLSPVSEEEKDFGKIKVRDDFYTAIVTGYKEEMDDALTATEKKYFFYAGTFMIYMQALRFITDHLNDDIYYGARYPDHNFVRGGNQLVLLERLMEKKERLSEI